MPEFITNNNLTDWIVAIGTAIIAVGTVVLAVFSYKAAQYTKKIWKNEQIYTLLKDIHKEKNELINSVEQQIKILNTTISLCRMLPDMVTFKQDEIQKILDYSYSFKFEYHSLKINLIKLNKILKDKKNKNLISSLVDSMHPIVLNNIESIQELERCFSYPPPYTDIVYKSPKHNELTLTNKYYDSLTCFKRRALEFNSELQDESEYL